MKISLQAVRQAKVVVIIIIAATGLMLIVAPPATAQSLHPCSFLAEAQISAVAGKVGAHAEGDMPGKAGMRACSWSVPDGLLVLSVMKVPNTKMSTRQLLDWMNSMYDALKGQGWKYEKKDFGNVSCSMLTPPSGTNGSPATYCATVAKGLLVIASTQTKSSIPMEKLKPLPESAATRLP